MYKVKPTAGELWLTMGAIAGIGLLITLVYVFVPDAWGLVTNYIKNFFKNNTDSGKIGFITALFDLS